MELNYKAITKVAGMVFTILGITMIFPFMVSLFYHETQVAFALLKTLIFSLIVGIVILWKVKPSATSLKIRDSFLIVALCWFLASLIGAFPYYLSDSVNHFIDAFFESTSGFTTTGVTILPDIALLPKGLIFWRSFTHWLGGMGILVFAISILPALGIGGQRIARAETPGPTLEKLSTRMSDSAKNLYIMYILLTIVAIILLKLGGLSFFDTLVHAFSSMGTGGLSSSLNGGTHFDSLYVETIVTIFSLLASINFFMYHHMIHGHWKDCLEDAEFKAFFIILGTVTLLITLNLWSTGTYDSFGSSFRHAFFQSSSFMSTSGYSSADFTLWPSFCQMALFLLLFIGGCSASTCGSIKVIRVLVFIKLIARGLNKRLHPTAVVPVKISGKTISSERISSITNFILLYFAIFIISTVIISLDNVDMVTTISASAAVLSNTGVGMGLVGPSGSFEIFSMPIRLYMSFLMLVGRLELFTIIVLLTPSFWNPRKQIHL